ncbi:MAG TPA: DUF222 domain-containing protein [Microlunatus sp.]
MSSILSYLCRPVPTGHNGSSNQSVTQISLQAPRSDDDSFTGTPDSHTDSDGDGGPTASAATSHDDEPPPADRRTTGQKRIDALSDLIALAYRSAQLPDHGGDTTQITVTVPYDVLTGELGPGMLDNGQSLTPETVRRMCCTARILPAVLGGHGQVLDVGRARRLISGGVRQALAVRDGGCAFPGCDRPPAWCEGHHITHWAAGGPTNLDNSVLLCAFHHRTIHHGDWTVRIAADRLPEFIPPTWIDPTQRPRRHHRIALRKLQHTLRQQRKPAHHSRR